MSNTKEYTFTTVRDILNLWNTNEVFKQQVGPTLCHLHIWLTVNNFVRPTENNGIMTQKDTNITLTYDTDDRLEKFLGFTVSSNGNTIRKYIFAYLYYTYVKNGILDITELLTDNNTPLITQEAKLEYIISRRIKLNKYANIYKYITTSNPSILYKLFNLGLQDPKKITLNNIDYTNISYLNTIYQYSSTGCKLFQSHFNLDYIWNKMYGNRSTVYNLSNVIDLYFRYRKVKSFLTIYDSPSQFRVISEKIASCTKFIHTKSDFIYYCFVDKDGIINVSSQIFQTILPNSYLYDNIEEFVQKYKLNINTKTSNGSYLIQFLFQDKNTTMVKKLLDMGAKLFDYNGKLLKGVDNEDIKTFAGEKYTYDLLVEHYKDDTSMLARINYAYNVKLVAPATTTTTFSISLPVSDAEKVEELEGMFNEIKKDIQEDDINIQLKVYYAKLLLKEAKKKIDN